MKPSELIRRQTMVSIGTKQKLLADERLCPSIEEEGSIVGSLRSGETASFAGNGGSATDTHQIEARSRPSDISIATSKSGNSSTIILACEAARQRNLPALGLMGASGKMKESHTLIGHIAFKIVESEMALK